VPESDSSAGRTGRLVGAFMATLHRYDRGRTLPILHRSGLTTPQLATLEVLREAKTVSAVASELGLSLPATSQMVDKLVRKRLVRRAEGRTDRRQRSVVVTSRGRTLMDGIDDARAARFDASLAALPASTRARLDAALADAVRALQAAPPREAAP
jgi:DNA-binding MarR family transcriptional regulator